MGKGVLNLPPPEDLFSMILSVEVKCMQHYASLALELAPSSSICFGGSIAVSKSDKLGSHVRARLSTCLGGGLNVCWIVLCV